MDVSVRIYGEAGEHATVTPLVGENDRLLTLKGEHAEKEIWLIIASLMSDGACHL